MSKAPKGKTRGGSTGHQFHPHGLRVKPPAKPAKPGTQHQFHPHGVPVPKSGKPKTGKSKGKAKSGAHQFHPHGVTAKRQPRTKRGAGDVACCVAEALAASLRSEGWEVAESDVLALYSLAKRASWDGVDIGETLEAVAEVGLAGASLASWDESGMGQILGLDILGGHAVFDDGEHWWSWGSPYAPFPGAVIEEAWAVRWELPG